MKKIRCVIAVAAALSISGGALALTTFDFTGGPGGASDSKAFGPQGGYTVVATSNAKVWHGKKGLGVISGLNRQIDNKGSDDKLFLNFGRTVSIHSFTIKGQDGNDRVWVKLDGGSWFNNGIVANNTEVGIHAKSQIIRFTQGRSSVGQQGYFLSSITVPDSGTSLTLLGLGMIGLACFGRRYKRQSS